MIQNFVAGFPPWVDFGVHLVTVIAFPIIASEGGDVGEGVVVEVEGWVVVVAETVDEEVAQPLPGGDVGGGGGSGVKQGGNGLGLGDRAVGVLAVAQLQAGFVGGSKYLWISTLC